jgi:hypothetical protein
MFPHQPLSWVAMSESMGLDEFLSGQGKLAGFTATLEAVPDKSTHVNVTPFHHDRGCGCASSFELPKEAIRSVTPTGDYHFCCGKRLQVVVVEFAEDASIPVADLVEQMHSPPGQLRGAPTAGGPGASDPATWSARRGGSRPSRLIGHWPIPFTDCYVQCIDVCTEFCGPTGWDCCRWETRCVVICNGQPVWTSY